MANKEHVKILKKGIEAWNEWRIYYPHVKPDLSGVDLSSHRLEKINLMEANLNEAKLEGVNLNDANLFRSNLTDANLTDANLFRADLSHAKLFRTNLIRADLDNANFFKANLLGANISDAHLTSADLTLANLADTTIANADFFGVIFLSTNLTAVQLANADFSHSVFQQTGFTNADFHQARLDETIFADCDLSQAKNLDLCIHQGPSSIDTRTLGRSIILPAAFLRGCGVPDSMINYLSSFKESVFQYYSCFLSHSSKDDEFAKKLYLNLTKSDVRCWYAPEDMKAGRKLHDQINEAIQIHDKLLLVLSENSISSDWVATEIKRARNREKQEGRTLFFPISLIPYEKLKQWELYDGGANLADEIRDYYIPDFSNWRDEKEYKEEFDKLRESLRTGKREK